MGIAERKEREKEQRREAILDAAEKIFFSKGMNQTTMDDIAEEAELSKGTLYLYFSSKEDLYLGIAYRALSLLENMFVEAVKKHKKGIQQIKAIGEAYYRYSKEHANYFNMILHYEISRMEKSISESIMDQCHQIGQKVMQVVSGAIQKGIIDKSIRANLDPVKTAYLLQGTSTGIIQLITREQQHLKKFENFNAQELMTHFTNFMYYALKS